MAYLSVQELDRIVGQSYKNTNLKKAVTPETDATKKYDIFLSHSRLDEKVIRQLNYLLEEVLGFDVYVDCVEDPSTNQEIVTPATANHLRDVMGRCASLIYAVSTNAASSKWMPWELGYSDATHGKVAILQITNNYATVSAYAEQEFLGLYPYIDLEKALNSENRYLWVNDRSNNKRYANLSTWQRNGALPEQKS